MKTIVLQIEDSAYETFMGLVNICPVLNVLDDDDAPVGKDAIGMCVRLAIEELRNDNVFRFPKYFTYVMKVMNENKRGWPYFHTPREFLEYLKMVGVDKQPSSSTLYTEQSKIMNTYPDWEFTDHPSDSERLKRNNVGRRFLSAFNKAKRNLGSSSEE